MPCQWENRKGRTFILHLTPILIGSGIQDDVDLELESELENVHSRAWEIVLNSLSYIEGDIERKEFDLELGVIVVGINTDFTAAQVLDIYTSQGKEDTWHNDDNIWKYGLRLDLDVSQIYDMID